MENTIEDDGSSHWEDANEDDDNNDDDDDNDDDSWGLFFSSVDIFWPSFVKNRGGALTPEIGDERRNEKHF